MGFGAMKHDPGNKNDHPRWSRLLQLSPCCRKAQLSMLDSAGAKQRVRNGLHLGSRTLDGDHLEAVVVIEMDVRGRKDVIVMVVLYVRKAIRQITLVVIVDERNRSNDFVVTGPLFLNQGVTNEMTQRF